MKKRYLVLGMCLLLGCSQQPSTSAEPVESEDASVAYETVTPGINCSDIKQEEGKDFKITDYCKVDGTLETTGTVNKDKAGKQKLLLTATDANGNITIKHVTANITAKPQATPEPEQKEEEQPQQNTQTDNSYYQPSYSQPSYSNSNAGSSSSSSSSSGGGSQAPSNPEPAQPAAPVATPYPEQTEPNYGFNTFGSYEACVAYMNSGHVGKCAAQADNMGNYTGLYMFIGG